MCHLIFGLIRVIVFNHRKSILPNMPSEEDCPANLTFNLNFEKSSSVAVYEYFSAKLAETKNSDNVSGNRVVFSLCGFCSVVL